MNKPNEHGPTYQEQPGRPEAGRTETSGMAGAVKEKARDLASGAADVAAGIVTSTPARVIRGQTA